jgi:hypothetical protein
MDARPVQRKRPPAVAAPDALLLDLDLRAAESAHLGRMMLVCRAAGARCALPLFDGALLAVPDAASAEDLAAGRSTRPSAGRPGPNPRGAS